MPRDQILMGVAIAVVCLVGLVKARWMLANTKKGLRLVNWLGKSRALWTLRALFAAGIALGVLLATDVVRPVQW